MYKVTPIRPNICLPQDCTLSIQDPNVLPNYPRTEQTQSGGAHASHSGGGSFHSHTHEYIKIPSICAFRLSGWTPVMYILPHIWMKGPYYTMRLLQGQRPVTCIHSVTLRGCRVPLCHGSMEARFLDITLSPSQVTSGFSQVLQIASDAGRQLKCWSHHHTWYSVPGDRRGALLINSCTSRLDALKGTGLSVVTEFHGCPCHLALQQVRGMHPAQQPCRAGAKLCAKCKGQHNASCRHHGNVAVCWGQAGLSTASS